MVENQITTGSLVRGCVDGMGGGIGGMKSNLINTYGNPNGIITITTISGLAFNGLQYYMALTGSTWIKLGSVA